MQLLAKNCVRQLLAYEADHPETYDDPISMFPTNLSIVPELARQEQLFLQAER